VSALLARAHRYTEDLGVPGVLGLALAVFCVAFGTTTLVPAYRELASARVDRDRVLERLAAREGSAAAARTDVHGDLERVLAYFPSPDEARQALIELQAAAARHAVKLSSIEYRTMVEPWIALTRYQIQLPARGSYAGMRAFLAEALETLPTLAPESASWKRDAAGMAELDARFVFKLYAGTP